MAALESESVNPKTWADGVGRWHASVPISTPARQAAEARRLIGAELDARGDRGPGWPLRVTREHVTNHGTVIYGEK